ncbi:MAG TPA: T9SS type A sorting domain-containing protein [Chitinophagaceae bacterium]
MKRKTLLLLVMISFITVLQAQKKQQPVTGYAITAVEKGGKSWKEVRQVNIATGEEINSIYKSTQEIQMLNARTGKPIVRKDIQSTDKTDKQVAVKKRVVNLDMELEKATNPTRIQQLKMEEINANHDVLQRNNNVIVIRTLKAAQVQTDQPFATNSAACAYDKKHERLYYTPMGINQLRYIDLKAKTSKVYYFEDEPFGIVKGLYDGANQITRMVIASDGDGYALTNDANHLIRFTTGKKPVITDLGALTDDAANGKYSVHSGGGFGGDMIADASGNLYLITANRNVFKIPLENKMAKFLGTIKGLPKGFSTNGTMVEEGSKVIIASSESTVGYYRFDLITLQAEKVSASANVFNASDLANGNLAFAKKKKDKNEQAIEEAKEETITEEQVIAKKELPAEAMRNAGISVYPNPVTNGFFKMSFAKQTPGKYQVQVVDMGGRLISSREVNIYNEVQVEEFRLPEALASGSYLVKVLNEPNKVAIVNKLVVQ